MATIEERVATQFEKMASYIARGDEFLKTKNASVSAWSIAEQLDHITKVCEHITRALAEGKEVEAKSINLLGRVIHLVGFFPRGRAKTPERVAGKPETQENLGARLARIQAYFGSYRERKTELQHTKHIINHPYFRGLTRPQAIRFIEVHNNHHFKIIEDILRN